MSSIKQQCSQSAQQNPPASPSQQYLQYYHIDSIQELIQIMLNPQESKTYNHIRYHPIPHTDLQNLTTIKSVIQYKRQLILNTIINIKQQMIVKIQQNGKQKDKDDKQKDKQKDKNKQKDKYEKDKKENRQKYNVKVNNNEKYMKIRQTRKKQQEIITTSYHSYQQLLNYFITNNNQLVCKKILQQKYLRSQIIHSHKIRKSLWLTLIGIHKKRQQYPLMYQSLKNYEKYHDFYTRIIHADVVRTVHDFDEKQKKQTMNKMQRILLSFARRNPYIGYCQGMNFILNFIITMQFQQQQSFWLLAQVLEDIVHMGYYSNMSGVAVDIKILSYILQNIYPSIHDKLSKLQIDISIFVLEWFVCLYTSTLPFYKQLLVIVWDLLLIQGEIVLFKVALIMLEYLKGIIQQANDFAHFFKLYQGLKKKIFIQEQEFLKKYNSLYIDEKILDLIRQLLQKQIKVNKQQLRKNMKQNQKWKQIQCNVQWPICFQQLKKQKLNDKQIDVWVLREQNEPKMITDYMLQKNKKFNKYIYKNNNEENEDRYKKLVIGRIPHICENNMNINNKNKKKWQKMNDGIQLDEVQVIKQGNQIKMRPINTNIDKQIDDAYQQQGSEKFFRRATFNSIAFQALKNLQRKHTY